MPHLSALSDKDPQQTDPSARLFHDIMSSQEVGVFKSRPTFHLA